MTLNDFQNMFWFTFSDKNFNILPKYISHVTYVTYDMSNDVMTRGQGMNLKANRSRTNPSE